MRERISFRRFEPAMEPPDLLAIQLKSFEEFLQADVPPDKRQEVGLQAAFKANFPITDSRELYELDFVSYTLDPPKYTEDECRERELTYSRALKAVLRLSSKADPKSEDYIETIEQEVYLGHIPQMTERGTFIINGSERVVVSQIHRSPGVIFQDAVHPNGTRIYSARVIPMKGSWLEFSTNVQQTMNVYIDRKKKFPVTMLLRVIGYSSDEDILRLFDLMEEVTLEEILKNPDQYLGRKIAGDIIDLETGEIIASRDDVLTEDLMERLRSLKQALPIKLFTYKADTPDEPIIARTLAKDPSRSREEALDIIYRQLRSGEPPDMETAEALIDRLFFNPKRYDLGFVGRYRINEKLKMNVPYDVRTLTPEDIIVIIQYLLDLKEGKHSVDDVDHLGNRRIRTVGEQLTEQLHIALARMARTIRERLSIQDQEELMPSNLVTARTITSVLNQFFGTHQLSQFMDQTNPLAETTHKRRISALGPGGLSRERAGFEVRDVHYTHYGRLCPIETPEGPNIGLINSLALYARVDELGFLETPYRVVKKGKVTDEIIYLRADREENRIIAPASTPIDKKGRLQPPPGQKKIRARRSGDFVSVDPEEVELMDVATHQITGMSASLIPFLEHDDANRALMGSNMQRQAVPLLRPSAPYVGTGMEWKIAKESRSLLVAEEDGTVEYVSADKIRIRYDDKLSEEEKLLRFRYEPVKEYQLKKFFRTNQNTCINQRPIVKPGQRVKKGEPLVDIGSTDQGELALGQNVLVAFMPWEGYNFEDAIVISERLVAEDVYTSIHIEEFTLQVRDTKRGLEEFTRDIPNLSEAALKDLDERGIIRVGAKVREGDILIGKVTPKGEVEPTPEEKLLRAIFGDKAGEVKDASLKAPPGLRGVVINTKLFSRKFRSREAEVRRREKRRQELLDKAEREQLKELRQEALRRFAKIVDGHKVVGGIRTVDGTLIFSSGTKLTEEKVLKRLAERKVESLDQIDLEKSFLEDDAAMALVRRLYQAYKQEERDIQDEFRLERQKVITGDELPPGIVEMAKVYVASKRKIQVGDKMAGRHGNKGVVAKIVPVEDMPFLPDGTPVDIILNPLGVPSRMNIGQLYETALGWAAHKLGKYFATPVFDGATWEQVQQYLREAGLPEDGRTVLYDGRTGEPFAEKVTVGYIYMMKLIHMVEDKIHARAVGPYALITQQPLGGKSQFGGQRFGEMEVWALEAYGAAFTLQEILTVKSDDIQGRSKAYEAIVKTEPMPLPHVPEAFNVLMRELRGLAIEMNLEE